MIRPLLVLSLSLLAANVLAGRLRRGWTQQDLAEAAELDVRHLQRIERGTINMRLGVLLSLAAALDVPPVQLFREADLPPPKAGRPSRPGERGTGTKTERRPGSGRGEVSRDRARS